MLFCDVDRFKSINDTYGHGAGDAVLHEIAARVNACIRRGDVAARVGGDEMLVVLDGVHDLADAVAIAEKVRRSVEQPIQVGDNTGCDVGSASAWRSLRATTPSTSWLPAQTMRCSRRSPGAVIG